MTTVVDPLGSPSIYYNRSGRNIQSIVAASGNSFGSATQITHVSGDTICLVDGQSNGFGFGAVFPDSNFEIGDTITIWFQNTGNVYFYNNSGTFMGTGNGMYMLVDATTWRKLLVGT
jgi:hypothetical protein